MDQTLRQGHDAPTNACGNGIAKLITGLRIVKRRTGSSEPLPFSRAFVPPCNLEEADNPRTRHLYGRNPSYPAFSILKKILSSLSHSDGASTMPFLSFCTVQVQGASGICANHALPYFRNKGLARHIPTDSRITRIWLDHKLNPGEDTPSRLRKTSGLFGAFVLFYSATKIC